MSEIEKTKVCSIFEPTYRSIMTLPTDDMRLRMFVALCNYAFDEEEPVFGSECEERILAALWEQFRLVFIQAKKRAKINSINGMKGGRPRKATESNWFSNDNLEKPTTTFTNTNTVQETSSSDSDLIAAQISEAFEVNVSETFSDDLIPSIMNFATHYEMRIEEIISYIQFVCCYVKKHSPQKKLDYFYTVITKPDMYETYLQSQK